MSVSQDEQTESLFDRRALKKEYNIESEVWVTENPQKEGNIFSHFSLVNFLNYDLNGIPKGTLMIFAKALKLKVLDNIMEIEAPYRDQLRVLCKITDGNQTERNQHIITKRMLTIIKKQESYSKLSSGLLNSQNTVSLEDLTSRYFSNSRKAEKNEIIPEVKPYFAAPERNKNYRLDVKGVTGSEVNTVESHNVEERYKLVEENELINTPVCNKALTKRNDTASSSLGKLTSTSQTSHKTFLNDVHEYVERSGYKTTACQKPPTKTDDTANELKDDMVIKSPSYKVYLEAADKNRNSENTAVEYTFSEITPHTNDIHSSDDDWDYTSEFDEVSEPLINNYLKEQWNIGPPIKETYENIDGNEQSLIANECIKPGKNQFSNSKERRNESSNFAGRSMRRFFADIKNESGFNRSNGWRPQSAAEESGHRKMKMLPSLVDRYPQYQNDPTFGHFSLKNLLNYDVDLMASDVLMSYANTLKSKVINKISEFESPSKEELTVLCEITDGTQTDRNQRIICSRICALVSKTLSYQQWNRKIDSKMSKY